jgi:molybdopterin-guanine dinucleotide biosynthesis protein A
MAVTGIILAGGKNLRFGRTKALEQVGNVMLIERVAKRILPLVDQLIIVTAGKEHSLPTDLGAVFINDIYPDGGALGGIYSGLTVSKNDCNLVVACDMPFLNTELLQHLIFLSPAYEAVVPRLAPNLLEPLHAVYSRKCIPVIRKCLDRNERVISTFLNEVKCLYVEAAECRQYDPNLHSFFNINNQNDLSKANKLINTDDYL